MLHGRPESAGWPEEPAVHEKQLGFLRARFAGIRNVLARRGPDEHEQADAGPRGRAAAGGPPLYVAAPPPPPTPGSPLFDTRLAREVRRLLGTLGATRGSVAVALEAAGVRAAPNDPERSPIGLFLLAVIGADPGVKYVRIDPDAVVVDLRAWWRPTVTVPLPPVVHDFRMAFDAGCYPALLREEFRPHDVDHQQGSDSGHAD